MFHHFAKKEMYFSVARDRRCVIYCSQLAKGGGACVRTLGITVTQAMDGRMVKGILRGELQLSYTLLKSLKWQKNAILLNGQSVHVNAIVHTGDVVSARLGERGGTSAAPPCPMALDIVYEDDDLRVLNKPAGIAMHPKSTDLSAPSMATALTAYLGEGSVAHFVSRLDKGTSGLFIAAKTGYVHDRLRRALHSDGLRREYRAVAVGTVTPRDGVIDLPIGRADGSLVKRCVRSDGLPSLTKYQTLETNSQFTLLRLVPHTGRTHQLRVHLSHLGYPLAGDWLYGTEDKTLIARPALHSCELWFTHPITGEALHFTSPLPEDMAKLMEKSDG